MSAGPLVMIDARDAYAPQLRGWGRYARCLIEALQGLAGRPFELELLREGWPGPEFAFEQLGLPLAARRRRASLLHATNCFLPLARPCPGVVTVNDLAFETWPEDFRPATRVKYRVLARMAARSAQRVICPSEYTAEDVCERYGVDRDQIRVIADAPALPEGKRDPPPGPYLLAVGDLRRKKNLSALVQSYAALRRDRGLPHRLILAGLDSGESGELRALAGEQPLELTGYVDDATLDALIRGAELLIHPSLYEGFGLVVLEAMARGTPVLAARATALPETGGEAAAYFDPGEPGSLREALEALLTDSGERERRSRAGLQWARGFSWEQTARRTAEVYSELL